MRRLLKVAVLTMAFVPAIYWSPVTQQFNSVQAAVTSQSAYGDEEVGDQPARVVPPLAVECRDVSPHDHAPFLREDLAFGLTGVDCQGDPVRSELETDVSSIREISSQCPWDPHGHPPFLRSDLAYGITGRDCAGSPVEPWTQ